ncbi:hypothetical protein ACB092_08G001900 [Castanea dentata]
MEPSISTMVLNFENKFDPYEAMSTPLYQTATFKQPSATENGPYDYTRSGNPTRDALESLLPKLDKADRAFCLTSGMAALAAVSHLVGTGDEIVAGDDLYGGTDRLLSKTIPKKGIVVKRVNTSDLDEVASAIGPRTKLVWLETPTNPRQQISDIRAVTINVNAWNDAGHAVNQIYDILYMMGRDAIAVGVRGDGGILEDGTILPNVGGYLPIIEQETVGEQL